MPVAAPVAAAIIGGGASLLGQGFNAFSQGKMNKKQRKWNEKMYGIQRQDALADWAMQNEYNSPVSQMARLRDAGLNPHLVYGNGADAQGGTVRSSSVDSWNPRAPQFDMSGVGSSMMQYYDARMKEAQIDNLKAANTVAVQDALLKAAQVLQTTASTQKTGVDTERSRFDLGLAQELKETSVEAARANVDRTLADTRYTLDKNEREAAMNAPNIRKALEEILTIRANRVNTVMEREAIEARIDNLWKDARLKELDIQLKEKGVQPGDSMWMRMLMRILENKNLNVSRYSDPKTLKGVPGGMNPFLDWRRLLDQ